jgi:hypothetical protein
MTAQITLDAELGTKYEDSGDSFDYPMLLEGATSNLHLERSKEDTAYLQPFGCLLVLDAKSLNVIAFNENALEMFKTISHAEPSIYESPMLSIGMNALSLSWNIVPHHYTRY